MASYAGQLLALAEGYDLCSRIVFPCWPKNTNFADFLPSIATFVHTIFTELGQGRFSLVVAFLHTLFC